ncbi:MAG TPA: hypothetical protein VK851_02935, partial [Anaerolineales bacterium]|nr:hypothetical protein [Anaerolineales bacterium]
GLVEWLIKNPRVKIHVYALLIALSIGQQFFNGNIFRRDWERQQEIFWQMKWRMPSLQPNTVILTDEIAVDYESDGSFIGPINWIYDPDFKRGNLHYLVLYTDNRLGKSLRSLEPHTDIQFRLRTVVFYGSTSQAVVIHMPENGCLRVLDPELGDHETYEKKLGNVVDAIHLTDTKRILPKELEPPDFLSTPERDWCYYYTKAELARQFKHWEQILLLQNEAGKNGFVSDDPFEWLPFIEANAMTSNLQTAHKLSKEALDADPRIRIGLCKVWERVQAANAGESDEETLILTALSDFKCLP